MSALIETISYVGQPLFIVKEKILAFTVADESEPDSPATLISVTAGSESEEWVVRESIETIRAKYDNA